MNGPDPVTSGPSGLPVGDLLTAGPVTVDLEVPAVVLAIGAHPDDIEFGCGATLAKWSSLGCTVHHVVLTDGSKGSWDPHADRVRLVEYRRRECLDAAAILAGPGGAPAALRVHFLEETDGELESTAAVRTALVTTIRTVRPDVVAGHDPWRRYRLHPDHRAAGYLTVDALVAARDHHFLSELGLEPWRPRALLLWEPDLPNHVEDVDGFEQTKVDALLCHTTQLESTMGVRPGSSPEAERESRERFGSKVRHQLASHGALAGLPRGEAFRLMEDL